ARAGVVVALLAAGLVLVGSGFIALGLAPTPTAEAAPPVVVNGIVWNGGPAELLHPARGLALVAADAGAAVRRAAARARRLRAIRREARRQPHTVPRATMSLYEHTVRRSSLRLQ